MSFVSSKGNILYRLINIELYKILAIINRAIKGLHCTPYSSPLRTRYGVSFWRFAYCHLYLTFVIAGLHAVLWYICLVSVNDACRIVVCNNKTLYHQYWSSVAMPDTTIWERIVYVPWNMYIIWCAFVLQFCYVSWSIHVIYLLTF